VKNALLIIVVLALIAIAGVAAKFAKPSTPDVDNKSDLIRVTSPLSNSEVKSPLVITGKARGTWFFEASFPVVMVDWDGRIIGEGHAEAQSNWMTEDFVPFEATLTFNVDSNAYSNKGALILKKDNPSGLPEHDDAIEIPVTFAKVAGVTPPPVEPSPVGRDCGRPNDKSCPSGFECVSRCGPPVAREDDPPPGSFCQPKGYVPICPICLAGGTLIDTPLGQVVVQDLREGNPVWTVNKSGERIEDVVLVTSKTAVSANHQMVKLVLSDGRTLLVSPGHPIIDGRTVGDLAVGEPYDGARVIATQRTLYNQTHTYDILPGGQTNFYFADGILVGSTLSPAQ